MFTGGRGRNSLSVGIIDSNVKNLALRAEEKINDFCNGMKIIITGTKVSDCDIFSPGENVKNCLHELEGSMTWHMAYVPVGFNVFYNGCTLYNLYYRRSDFTMWQLVQRGNP